MTDIVSDYSLTGISGKKALENGLADAIWYTPAIPKEEMRKLLVRKDAPAIRDTLIWFSILGLAGWSGYLLWGTAWAAIPFAVYGIVYASSSDSRWHESGHGTAFKTDWLNNSLYEVASFMVFRESVPWRWSHTRHHTDTIIVGRDPEIMVPRPANIVGMIVEFFYLKHVPTELRKMAIHAGGKLTSEESNYIPASENKKVYTRARIYLLIYALVIGSAIYANSWLPLMYVGLPSIYGTWLMRVYGHTQHTGLAENVTDHRLNTRTVYMNFINRYLYWNMNYHVEHHMFPMVPYHALPRLHALLKNYCPEPYNGLWEAWKEIIPTVFKQARDPHYFIKRELPTPNNDIRHEANIIRSTEESDEHGWVKICAADKLHIEDVLQFDHSDQTFAVYRSGDGLFYATDGNCTHGNTHLADGLVQGNLIECPKHNGRFDIRDGSVERAPVCVALKTYDVDVRDDMLFLDLSSAGGMGAQELSTHTFRVLSNDNLATFIKELVLEPETISAGFQFRPGDYIQLDIPPYDERKLEGVNISEPYAEVWQKQHLFDLEAANYAPTRRNYSLASNPEKDDVLRFNIRIATPPIGQLCKAGTGSAYIFNLRPGDVVTAVGPFGNFGIKDTDREMVYLGGGSGMAPLRSHICYLLETLNSDRNISFWYGARSEQEMFYREYFEDLESRFDNFSFHYAYSEPLPEDSPAPFMGFIHDALYSQYLSRHDDPSELEYYLCGPPLMMRAAKFLLKDLNVPEEQIAYDEF